MSTLKMYIAVLDIFPDFMVPTLVAHAVLGGHRYFMYNTTEGVYDTYHDWLENSFKKCVLRVNQKEFDKIAALPHTYQAHENSTLGGKKACAVVCPRVDIPNVLKFAKLWKPKEII